VQFVLKLCKPWVCLVLFFYHFSENNLTL
jgi:hypothetical protein